MPPFTLTGADVKHLRGIVGVSQAELARGIGYSPSSICKWERQQQKSIPRTQYERVLAFLRTHYNVAEAQRVQVSELEELARSVKR